MRRMATAPSVPMIHPRRLLTAPVLDRAATARQAENLALPDAARAGAGRDANMQSIAAGDSCRNDTRGKRGDG